MRTSISTPRRSWEAFGRRRRPGHGGAWPLRSGRTPLPRCRRAVGLAGVEALPCWYHAGHWRTSAIPPSASSGSWPSDRGRDIVGGAGVNVTFRFAARRLRPKHHPSGRAHADPHATAGDVSRTRPPGSSSAPTTTPHRSIQDLEPAVDHALLNGNFACRIHQRLIRSSVITYALRRPEAAVTRRSSCRRPSRHPRA